MEELFTYTVEQFQSKLKQMTIPELQQLLWKLEEKYENMRVERKNNQSVESLDKIGISKPLQAVEESLELRRKIRICRETLLAAKYHGTLEQAATITELGNFSWGIKTIEPKVMLEGNTGRNYWKKFGGDAPISIPEIITVTNCGEFRWAGQRALSIQQMPDETRGIPFDLPAYTEPSGRTTIQGEDLLAGVNNIQRQTGELKVLKVSVQGEQDLEYFMLASIKNMDKIDPNKLEQFFITTYTSQAHQDMVRKSLETGKCLYGGTIEENSNGKLEVRFYESFISAVEKANMSIGTFMTQDHKVRAGNMQDMMDWIAGGLTRAQAQKALASKKEAEIGNTPDGR